MQLLKAGILDDTRVRAVEFVERISELDARTRDLLWKFTSARDVYREEATKIEAAGLEVSAVEEEF